MASWWRSVAGPGLARDSMSPIAHGWRRSARRAEVARRGTVVSKRELLTEVWQLPYGGYKQSGIGREFSLEGMLDSFTQRKNVTVNLNVPRR